MSDLSVRPERPTKQGRAPGPSGSLASSCPAGQQPVQLWAEGTLRQAPQWVDSLITAAATEVAAEMGSWLARWAMDTAAGQGIKALT